MAASDGRERISRCITSCTDTEPDNAERRIPHEERREETEDLTNLRALPAQRDYTFGGASSAAHRYQHPIDRYGLQGSARRVSAFGVGRFLSPYTRCTARTMP